MRRPVRTMTWPPMALRRIALGEPTSPLVSGVMVAALRPSLWRFIASAAWWTTAFCGLAPLLEREVIALKVDLEADHVGGEHPQRFDEQFLSGLIALEDDDGRLGHDPSGSRLPSPAPPAR